MNQQNYRLINDVDLYIAIGTGNLVEMVEVVKRVHGLNTCMHGTNHVIAI